MYHDLILCLGFDFCISEVIQGPDFSVSCCARCSKCSYSCVTYSVSCIVAAYIKLSSENLGIKPRLLWCHKVSLMCVCTAFQFRTSCVVFPLSGLWKLFLGQGNSFRLRKTDCYIFEKRHNWKCISDQITREDNLLRGPLAYKDNLENMIYSWNVCSLVFPLAYHNWLIAKI